IRSASHARSASARSAKTGCVLRPWTIFSSWAAFDGLVISHRSSIMMNELNRICAFSDTRRHSLDRAIPDVSGDKNSRDTRFEEPWLEFEQPIFRRPSSFEQVRPGKNKSL